MAKTTGFILFQPKTQGELKELEAIGKGIER